VADVLVKTAREELTAGLTGCVRACGEGQEDLRRGGADRHCLHMDGARATIR
jgi:hypothetical protein